MIKELDGVVLAHDIPEHGLKCGDVGTVVHRYRDGRTFEVEFVTAGGDTVAVLTLGMGDIRPLDGTGILHVRDFVPEAPPGD